MEYVLITQSGCIAADIVKTHLPLKWHAIDAMPLLKPGLYLRRSGGLQLISRDLDFGEAVLYALWEDPDAQYPVGDRWVRTGVHAGFLVRNPSSEGPPWIPIIAAVKIEPAEYETGILSPWLDQVAAVRFKPALSIERDGLMVATAGGIEEEKGTEAFFEAMQWLADNPSDNSSSGAAARTMLVENGHGLQRLGLALNLQTEDARDALLRGLLTSLAPACAELLIALWEVWRPRPDDTRTADARYLALLDVLVRVAARDGALQRPHELSTFTTWSSGLFGFRPERENLQPQRALFCALQTLREVHGNVDALRQPDAELPIFPLPRLEAARVVREVAPGQPFDRPFDQVVRALATAEAGREIFRPRLAHLSVFREALPHLRGYPIAARTLTSRYDYILSSWSFRGHETATGRSNNRWPANDLILDVPSMATSRAYARVLGANGPFAGTLRDVLSTSEHPTVQGCAELSTMETSAVIEAFREAATHRRITSRRLFAAITAAEFLIARAEAGGDVEDFELLEPELPDESGSAVRGHFMYWRMFCRSMIRSRVDRYVAFASTMLPQLDTLPAKLQGELFALVRGCLRNATDDRSHMQAWLEPLNARFDEMMESASAFAEYRGERVQTLLTCINELDPDAYIERLSVLVDNPEYDGQDLDMIIDAPRRAGWQRAFVANPYFRKLHRRIGEDRSVRGIIARAEWTRAALDSARFAFALRWLTDARTQSRFLASTAFLEWFDTRGQAAIDDPDTAVVELVELAATHLPDADLDRLFQTISRITKWPADEVLRLFLEADRPFAALTWMRQSHCADHPTAAKLATNIALRAERPSEMLRAAEAIAFVERRFGTAPADAVEALRARIFSVVPSADLLGNFGDILDAWRVVDLPCEGATFSSFLERASEWAATYGDHRLWAFVTYGVHTSFAQAARQPLAAWLRGETKHIQIPLPSELAELPVESKSDAAQKGVFSVRRMLRASSDHAPIARMLGAVVQDALYGDDVSAPVSRDAVLEKLAELATERVKVAPSGTRPESVAPPASEEASPEADEPPRDGASAIADSDDREQHPGEIASERRVDAAEPIASALHSSAKRSLAQGAALWASIAPALSTEAPRPAQRQMIDATLRFSPCVYAVREAVIATVLGCAANHGLQLEDAGRVLTTEQLDFVVAHVDLSDVLTVAHALAGLAARDEGGMKIILDRFEAIFIVDPPRPKAGRAAVDPMTVAAPSETATATTTEPVTESAAESMTAAAPEDALPDEASASDAEASDAEASDAEASDAEASDAEASDAEASDAEASDAEASHSAEAEPVLTCARRVARWIRGDSDGSDVFDDPLTSVVIAHLVGRNVDLHIEASRDSVKLRWRPARERSAKSAPRRDAPRERSGGRGRKRRGNTDA